MSVYVNNITINTGEYFSRDFYLDNLDGTPLDLTLYSGSSQIRKHANSLNPTATFTLTFVDRAKGRIRLVLSRETTATIKPGRYVYDILFTDDSGKKSVVIEGNILATADVSLGCTFPEHQSSGSGGGGSSGGGGGSSGELAYDYYLISYEAPGTVAGISTLESRVLATRTIVTSPDPQTISGYTGFSTVGYGYTTRFQPAYTYRDEDVPAHVGIPTYLSFGGGNEFQQGLIQSAIGSNRIVFGSPYYEDYDGSLVGIAGTATGAAYVFDLDGNPITQIHAPDGTDNDYFGSHVHIWNDKIYIADDYYSGTHDGQGAIYVFDMDGNFERRITLSSPAENDEWPAEMTVDNGKIFSVDYDENLYIHNIDGTGEIKIESSSLTNPTQGDLGLYGVAAGGDKFAVADSEQVYIFNQDGSGETLISAPVDANGNTSGYFGSNIAIAGDRLFVADPYYENVFGDYIGAVYSYDLYSPSTAPTIFTTIDEEVDQFEYQDYYNENMLVATTDYVWYGAIMHSSYTGTVYRWDFDGSNNIEVSLPDDYNYDQRGQNISADSASNRLIVGVADYGREDDAYLYEYASTGGQPIKRMTDYFDEFHDYVLLDANNVVSSHPGTQEIALQFRAGFKQNHPNYMPPSPYNNVTVTVTGFKGGTMERFGGTWINPTASQTTVVGITSGIVEPVSDNMIRKVSGSFYNSGRMDDLGARISLGNIDLVNGTITFT